MVLPEQRPSVKREHLLVRLPHAFMKEDEIGLGELVKRMTRAAGIAPCGGCEKRAYAMDQWLVLTRKPGP